MIPTAVDASVASKDPDFLKFLSRSRVLASDGHSIPPTSTAFLLPQYFPVRGKRSQSCDLVEEERFFPLFFKSTT